MNPEQQHALLALALYAAFAEEAKHEREREAIRSIAESLGADTGERQLVYEMAVCVCNADGRQSEAERRFLGELKALLRLDAGQAEIIDGEADIIVELTEAAAPAVVAGAAAPCPVVAARLNVPEAELDKSILKHALFNGALELLPQSWASLAIIPLQIKMVYGIGKAYGVELDQGSFKEFIAAGVGLTSQYLEQFGRKLLAGLLGKAGSAATTYALGQAAKRNYSGGRVMSTDVLLGQAKQMQTQYLPQIRQQAETLDLCRVMAMVRGA